MATISPSEYEARIEALEKLNATLAAEIDRMSPVIDTAVVRANNLRQIHPDGLTGDEIKLVDAVITYEQSSGGKDGADGS